MHQYIEHIGQHEGRSATLKGWVFNVRFSKTNIFVELRDGTGHLQCVISEERVGSEAFEQAKQLGRESSLALSGEVVKDERQVGGYELQVDSLEIYQIARDYPMKLDESEHGPRFLADKRHLWLRSKRQWAIMRVRNAIIMAIHRFFQEQGFVQMDSPIFTGNAVEGTTDLFGTDFFGDPAYLSQSGQLYAEATAMAMGKVYTFGPTFRAEKSDTPRHLAEFWMIEPEMAFYDLEMDMDLIETFVRSVVTEVLGRCGHELEVLGRDVERLKNVGQAFPRIPYTEAVRILRGEQNVGGRNAIQLQEEDLARAEKDLADAKAEIAEREANIKDGSLKKGERKFNESKILALRADVAVLEEKLRNIPKWIESAKNFEHGNDLGNSDETVLTRVFDAPVMVYNWPAPIKAFYMKEVEGDPNYVKGVDLLAPDGYGEIVGGSERETDIEVLLRKIEAHKLPQEAFEWYLDLRRFGSVPHAGFGLGLERLVRWICGIHHLRETIPFPRRYGTLFP